MSTKKIEYEYWEVVQCSRCEKFLPKHITYHFCETKNEYDNSWTFLKGYDKNKSKGFWRD